MKSILKKLSIGVILAALVLSTAACTKTAPAASTDSAASSSMESSMASTEAPAAPAEGTALSDADYKAEVTRIYNAIAEKSAAMGTMDATDPAATMTAMNAVIVEVQPLYEELAALSAPEAMKEVQATIADGATASVEVLTLSTQLMEASTSTDQEAAAKLATELQAKIAELTPKVTAFGEAITKAMA